MKEKQKSVAENIHILHVRIIDFQVTGTKDFLNNPSEPSKITFSLGKEIGHDFDKGTARYRLFFDCQAVDNDDIDIGLHCKMGIEFHFFVDHFKDYLKELEGEVKIDIDLGANLMAIAYSTSRGLILAKTQNTYFSGIILPVIDPHKFLLSEELE